MTIGPDGSQPLGANFLQEPFPQAALFPFRMMRGDSNELIRIAPAKTRDMAIGGWVILSTGRDDAMPVNSRFRAAFQ
jgi:hypothetical protein